MTNKRGQPVTITKRDHSLVQGRLKGKTYRELADQYGISKTTVYRVLNKDEIKDVLDAGTSQMISMIPLACDVHYKAMGNEENPALALKAAETVLKTSSIMPGNSMNATINQVINIQNNMTLSPTMAKALSGFLSGPWQDSDAIDVEPV